MWTAANNTGYNYRITGIGRDDCSALNQKQSGNRDTVTAGYVTVALGSLAASNADNTTDFDADKAFLTFGDNNGATTFSTAIAGQFAVNYRMARAWKVQETGAVGTVQVLIPDNGMDAYMILSDDATFDNTDEYLPMTAVTVNGVNYLATDVDLANAQYFSFGAAIKAPGGIAGASLWLRPDKGTSSTVDNTAIETWSDNSSSGNSAEQPTPANQPLYAHNATDNLNFNPVVKFNGTGNFMNLDVTKLPIGTTARTLIGVGNINNLSGNRYIISWGTNTTSQGMGIASVAGAGQFVGTANDVASPGFWKLNTPDELTGVWAGAGGAATLYSRTKQLATAAKAWNTGGAAAKIGAYLGNDQLWSGTIGDVIVYPVALTATERQRVSSYLAIKYGYTLDQTSATDYLATDGATKVWDAATNGAYKINIAGIGRDDVEDLNQKQSRSIHTGSILTVALGDVATTNADNTNTFAQDKSYFVWSSNSAALTTSATDLPAGSCMEQRLTQEWKTQLTNFDNAAQPLRLQFDLTGITVAGTALSDFLLLIDQDGDGDFTTGTVTRIPATDFNSGIVGFDNITTLTNGVVLTLVTRNPAATRTAALVADNTVKNVITECVDNDWLYFIDPADATKYIAAIQLNGNTMDVAQLSAVIDVNRDMNTALGKNSGTDYGTQLMRRLVQIN
jgi:hypothetical protein